MRFIYCSLLFSFLLVINSCKGQDPTDVQQEILATSRIEVVDFHSTHRCKTCNNIEANTRYTLDTYFSEEMEKGKLTLAVLNVEKDENYKMAEKFQAIGTSLYLNIVSDGHEEQVDLTQFAFKKGNDKEAFTTELKSTIDQYLKDL